MNIILLEIDDWLDEQRIRLFGRRHQHLQSVLKVQAGDSLRIGALGGMRGTAQVESTHSDYTDLIAALTTPPLPRHPLKVVLALPRPKMLRRVLRSCAEFGVSELHLIHSARVEKSFWQSPLMNPDNITKALHAGLERSGDTIAPVVELHRRFRPFVEDRLNDIAMDKAIYCLHPGSHPPLAADTALPATVLIGPEGGFIPFELHLVQENGALMRHLGGRVLSVDTALTSALARELPSR